MFPCEKCNSDTSVIDSRYRIKIQTIRRRRQCDNPKCGHRFTTVEYLKADMKTDKQRKALISIRKLLKIINEQLDIVD